MKILSSLRSAHMGKNKRQYQKLKATKQSRNKTFLFLTNIVFLLSLNDLLAQPSLFLSTEEICSIYSNLPSSILENPPVSKRLSLLAILYVNENHWSVWANNSLLRSETSLDIDGFHVEQVLFNSVTFSWISPDSSELITFSLRPGQTYKKEE